MTSLTDEQIDPEPLQTLAEHIFGLSKGQWFPTQAEASKVVAAVIRADGIQASPIPEPTEGWKLLKDTSQAERSFPEDGRDENGNYCNACMTCLRMFVGYKRRVVCKVCRATPELGEDK